MILADAERILVTTFADDQRMATAEWVVGIDSDRVGFWTPDVTAWQERLVASDVVSVQAADHWGKAILDEPVLEGRAHLVLEGREFDVVREATRAKYSVGTAVAGLADKVRELGGSVTPEGVVLIHIVA